MQSSRFAALVPVKRKARGKSRLASLGDPARQQLVTAFALDTVTALLGAPAVSRVLVVTDDLEVALACRELGAEAIPDGGSDLNDALVQAAAEVARRQPELGLMAVVADLPTLDAESVEEIVAGFTGQSTGFVADASGLGTTAYLAVSYGDFEPHFGPGSAQAHRSAGAREIDLPKDSRARDDIDTPDDLDLARAHVGAHTRRALIALEI